MDTVGSTAEYLARSLCTDRGFRPGMPEEAAPLAGAAPIALTKADGMTFTLLLIVDRETDPGQRFAGTMEQLLAVGQACAKYTGQTSGVKIPVVVEIWEVGRDDGEWARLAAFGRNRPGKEKVAIRVFAVNAATGRVHSSALWNGVLAGRIYAEKLLRAPRRADELLAAPAAPLMADKRPPVVTFAILGVLIAAFVGELAFGVKPTSGLLEPDIQTLVAAGGLFKPLVQQGEWWRLFTCAFLHAHLMHLVLNGMALVIAGVVLESVLGRAWLVALFVLGALGGAGMSYAFNPANMVSVGASGAIMGLLAATFVSSFRLPAGGGRTQVQILSMRILVPAMLPLALTGGSGQVDYGAHLGGAIVGALAGGILLATWPAREPHPRFRGFARAVVAGGLVLFAAGLVQVTQHYSALADEARLQDALIPSEQLEAMNDEQLDARAEELIQQHPHDPRGYLYNAERLAKAKDLAGAAAQLRRGLEEKQVLAKAFKPELEQAMRGLLAAYLLEDGKRDEAAAAVAPVCKAGPNGTVPENLVRLNLCP